MKPEHAELVRELKHVESLLADRAIYTIESLSAEVERLQPVVDHAEQMLNAATLFYRVTKRDWEMLADLVQKARQEPAE